MNFTAKALFSVMVIALATLLTWSHLMTGGDWVTVATWTTAILLIGEPVGVGAAGYMQTKAQAKDASA